jgi:hypothetical protein
MSNTRPLGSNQVLKLVYHEILEALRVTGTVIVSPSGIFAATPTLVNIATAANTETSYALPANTKKLIIKARGSSVTKLTYTSGASGTTYITISPGSVYEEIGILTSGITLYFQTSKIDTVEIVTWV